MNSTKDTQTGMNNRSIQEQTLVLPKSDKPSRIVMRKFKLLALSGPRQGKEFVLDKETFTIGSAQHNDLVLQDSTVSRRHCEIEATPDGPLIRDLGSTNGTIVQGVRVTEAFLTPGSEFQLGQSRMVFCPMPETFEYLLSDREAFGQVVGKSIAMRRVFYLAGLYAPTDETVLIEGETGTGKEIVAEEIHRHSPRKRKRFIVIDCGSLARQVVESELFGHEKGAFTGANTERKGAFEHANGGTVLVDEVGDLDAELQPKLLRVLEKKEIRRVGSNRVRPVDVRIIAATNRNLRSEVNEKRFREDLYYRLSAARIELPPLRKRKEDIPLLARVFLDEFFGQNSQQQIVDFDKTMDAFMNHAWPGNVRELRNLIKIASYNEKRPIDLSAFLYFGIRLEEGEQPGPDVSADRPFKEAKHALISGFERRYLQDLLRLHGGNISKAAREAGIERAYLQRLIRKYGLN